MVVKTDKGEPVIVWQATARIHDLRHTYASFLASHGLSLPIIGALLGHTQPQTTARYAHLLDDPLRAATERVGAIVAGAVAAGPAKAEGNHHERRVKWCTIGQPAEPAEDDPPPVTEIDAPKPLEMLDLRRELTEEEKAKSGEELRRSQTIAKGLHPDTGKHTRPGDRKRCARPSSACNSTPGYFAQSPDPEPAFQGGKRVVGTNPARRYPPPGLY